VHSIEFLAYQVKDDSFVRRLSDALSVFPLQDWEFGSSWAEKPEIIAQEGHDQESSS
jgi:hypothetical protein